MQLLGFGVTYDLNIIYKLVCFSISVCVRHIDPFGEYSVSSLQPQLHKMP